MTTGRIVALALAAALVLGACSDDGGSDATPSATATSVATSVVTAVATPSATAVATSSPSLGATPTATATAGVPTGADQPGDAGFREFARRLDAGLQAQGAAAIKARWRTVEVVCRAEDVPRRADGAACEQAGVRYQGVESSSWRSSGGIAPVERVNERLDAASSTLHPEVTDRYGDGSMRVYALANTGAYRTLVTAVITSPPDFGAQRPIRVAWLFTWEFATGEWRATKIMFAYVLAEDLLDPTAEGRGVVPGWERFQP